MKAEKISELTTNRLSVYLRCLTELAASGQKTVSSAVLARKFHLNSAQIRKDLAYFGEFGTRGVGYCIEELCDHLRKILGLERDYKIAIVGAGRIGSAIADYYGFSQKNFTVAALFDSNKALIGKKINGVQVFDIKNFSSVVKKDKIDIAIVAVPAKNAQSVLDKIEKAGVRAVLNLAPVPLKAVADIKVKNVDLTISLESLSYFLSCETNSVVGVKPISRTGRKK